MRDSSRLGQVGLMAAGAVIAIVAYEAGRARAGVPVTQPLVYSGTLTDASGAPATGSYDIAVQLFSGEGADAKSLCATASGNTVLDKTGGRFSIPLDDSCAAEVVKPGVEPWVEVRVDGNAMPRTKIAAVPYALEADAAHTANALSSDAMKALTADLADLACPSGYEQTMNDGVLWPHDFTVCHKGTEASPYDEIVKVGMGASAFWIDRYEATIWTDAAGGGGPLADPPADFPKNGQVTKGKEVFALSARNMPPSGNLTWFQAAEACAASRKRLPNSWEWLSAARGTFDPEQFGGMAPNSSTCNTATQIVRNSGLAEGNTAVTSCVSDWGAEDMIGNLEEWTLDWGVATGNNFTLKGDGSVDTVTEQFPWGDLGLPYSNDSTTNIDSRSVFFKPSGLSAVPSGLPAAIVRGGGSGAKERAGILFLSLEYSPAFFGGITFRCVVPR